MINIYLEEIEEIVDLIRKYSDEVFLRVGDYEFDGLDELIQNIDRDTKIDRMEIFSRYPYLNVDMDKDSMHVYANEDVDDYFILKMKSIVEKSRNRTRFFISGKITVIIFIFGLFLLLLGVPAYKFIGLPEWEYLNVAVNVTYLSCFLVVGAISFFDQKLRKVNISIDHKYKEIGFLEKNKESIMVAVCSAFISGVLLLLIQKYFL